MTDSLALFRASHAELVARAGHWLRQTCGCGVVFTEMVTIQNECPDAIGWRNSGGESFVVECKTSRADFHADKNKSFRRDPALGMGRWRYFMCPPGVIRVDDLPPRWGLIYCHPKVIELVHGRHPRKYDPEASTAFLHNEFNQGGELRMFYSALSRLKIDMGERAFIDRVHLPYTARQKERAA